MSTIQVCVNCGNKNPINGTNNRLVTESCGHVKCMHCLLHEISGCAACRNEAEDLAVEESLEPEISLSVNTNNIEADAPELLKEVIKGRQVIEFPDNGLKTKLDIGHIIIEPDGSKKTYTCTICDKKFSARSQVVYHAYCNGQRKPFQCQICNKSFATRSHYDYHTLMHTKERPHKCNMCSASFIQKSKLERHKLQHTNERNHVCKNCDKAFNNISSLRKHMRTHTGERPYSCPTCGHRFRDSSNYRKHLRNKHSGCARGPGAAEARRGRTHRCAECAHSFSAGKDLRRHLQVHSDKKPYQCKMPKCTAQFRRKDNYNRHMRNSHSGDTHVDDTQQNGTASPEEKTATKKLPEESKLKVLNPLPPLPEEVIQKHLYTEQNAKPVIDKSYIIEANHARESVIVGKGFQRKNPSPTPETQYVHKIRRANLCHKEVALPQEVTLPPIDEEKFLKLTKDRTYLDVGPLPKNIQTYKNILHDKQGDGNAPKVHWRKLRLTDTE